MVKYYNKATDFEDCVEKYLKEIKDIPRLTREEEKELFVKIKDGDTKALQKLLKHNLPFVLMMAKKYRGQGISFSDIIGEGNLGLAWAAKKFDYNSKDTKFCSYAVWWIKNFINEAIESQNKITGSGDYQDFQMINITTPNLDEDENLVYDNSENEVIDKSSRDANVDELLSLLKDYEKEIIKDSFGLDGHKEISLMEIGKKMNMSTEKVRKIKDNAINLMKFHCLSKTQDEFNDLKLLS